jgi:phage terminase small subunit
MGKLPNHLKTSAMLTPKQRKFVDVLVANWGKISKAAAVREAGYTPKRDNGASEIGSKLTNPNKCPHVVRYLEKKLQAEMAIYEKDKLRSYKQYDRMREGAIEKSQYNAESTPKTEGYLFLQRFPCPWFWNLGQRTTDLRCIT